ncbi:hypothetical protein JV16_01589 [Anoxybacillus ayderensis]|uniref:Uncharacterized protein n=1 Tax=Anoxybacillus ayderensis TaxID=265546 RepID=A0A0D0G6S0_9BACL|nr:hypothetical protein [Anoxybacillus ayderensis]KIP21095.1 hypothetical protein JV16_01589 [Anoxybacillus ayderensis]
MKHEAPQSTMDDLQQMFERVAISKFAEVKNSFVTYGEALVFVRQQSNDAKWNRNIVREVVWDHVHDMLVREMNEMPMMCQKPNR